VTQQGIHIFAKNFHAVSHDAMSLFSKLNVENDGGHAFYLGAELMRAELAYKLGKRYQQDEPLEFGVAVDRNEEDTTRVKKIGHTMRNISEGKFNDAADS